MGRNSGTPAVVVSAARLAVGQWQRRLGDAGFAAMRRWPWLVALVDQHAAAVREALVGRDGSVSVTDLAAYADGVVDAATRRGWSATEVDGGDWRWASWASVRLLAVCAMAHGTRPEHAT